MSAAIRFREATAMPLRASKSASRRNFPASRRSSGRLRAHRFASPRKNERCYDRAPQARQFLQTDPVGYDDDLNLYQYAANDPITFVDPNGEEIQIAGDETYFVAVNEMLAVIQQSPEGSAAVHELKDSPNMFTIAQPGALPVVDQIARSTGVPGNQTISQDPGASNGEGGDAIIYFDNNITTGGADDTGSEVRPPAVGLGHEVGHAVTINRGEEPAGRETTMTPGTTPTREQRPLQIENAVRRTLGLPQRSTYYPPASRLRQRR